jgi:transposase-like protein
VIGSTYGFSAPAGYRFRREVIALAVRWYLRYGLSYRDVEELLAEGGVDVDHVTIYRRVQTLTAVAGGNHVERVLMGGPGPASALAHVVVVIV